MTLLCGSWKALTGMLIVETEVEFALEVGGLAVDDDGDGGVDDGAVKLVAVNNDGDSDNEDEDDDGSDKDVNFDDEIDLEDGRIGDADGGEMSAAVNGMGDLLDEVIIGLNVAAEDMLAFECLNWENQLYIRQSPIAVSTIVSFSFRNR